MDTDLNTDPNTGLKTEVERPTGIRASDAEREATARTIQEAAAQGRLTVQEADERLAEVFATTYREELPGFVADLPTAEPSGPAPGPPPGRGPTWWRGRVPFPLAVHAMIVVVWATLLIGRWAVEGAGFFWPAFPIFWLIVSLLVHATVRLRRRARTEA